MLSYKDKDANNDATFLNYRVPATVQRNEDGTLLIGILQNISITQQKKMAVRWMPLETNQDGSFLIQNYSVSHDQQKLPKSNLEADAISSELETFAEQLKQQHAEQAQHAIAAAQTQQLRQKQQAIAAQQALIDNPQPVNDEPYYKDSVSGRFRKKYKQLLPVNDPQVQQVIANAKKDGQELPIEHINGQGYVEVLFFHYANQKTGNDPRNETPEEMIQNRIYSYADQDDSFATPPETLAQKAYRYRWSLGSSAGASIAAFTLELLSKQSEQASKTTRYAW